MLKTSYDSNKVSWMPSCISLAQVMIWTLSLSTEVTTTEIMPFKLTLSATHHKLVQVQE